MSGDADAIYQYSWEIISEIWLSYKINVNNCGIATEHVGGIFIIHKKESIYINHRPLDTLLNQLQVEPKLFSYLLQFWLYWVNSV